MEFIIRSESEMKEVSKALLNYAGSRRKIALSGEVGAGKTTLVQHLCRELGVREVVTSPTYALVNQYQGSEHLINHLDLYRLKDYEEALNIGIEDFLFDQTYCFIEWPELIELILPSDIISVDIKIIDKSSRKILFL